MVSAMQSEFESSGGRLVSVDGKVLPLKAVTLNADAKAGLARVLLTQTFSNPYAEPLKVTYQLALPADGAVSGFAFTVGSTRIVGEVDKKAAARERFERALIEGHTASLLEQERTSLFTQEVGNIPPGAEVRCEVEVDQKLAWMSEGGWEWRFPTVVAPRYQGQAGRVTDAAQLTVSVSEQALPIRFAAELNVRDALVEASRPESPSHAIQSRTVAGALRIELCQPESGAPALDRDVVLRWKVAQPRVGVALDVARTETGPLAESAFGLLTLVPPVVRSQASVRRDLIVLLDTSGSMGGEPLDQARRVVSALIGTLGDEDRLELIEFSNDARRWKSKPVNATEKHKKDALKWLSKLQASGGTEMRTGIYEALTSLDDEAQRQVILITDGLIGFESEVVRTIAEKCPPSCRVHTVGVGSGVNRSLTGPAARAGRGTEVVISLGEDPERAAQRVVARTDAPTVVEVRLTGSALLESAPVRIPDLFAASPSLVALKLRPEGGTLTAHGRTAQGEYTETLTVAPVKPGEGNGSVVALFGREKVEDLELRVASGEGGPAMDAQIEALGISHQISTRLTSWVAVSAEATVDPGAPTRHEELPQMLPHGMSVTGLGLRSIAPPAPMVSYGGAPPLGGPSRSRSGMAIGEKLKMKKEALRQGRPSVSPPPPPRKSAPSVEEGGISSSFDEPSPSALADEAREDEAFAPPQAPAPASAPPSMPKGAAEAKERRLLEWLGRIVLRSGGELVLEVTCGSAFEWDPTQSVVLHFSDGTRLTLTPEAQRSTRKGRVEGGSVFRITLALPQDVSGQVPVGAALSGLPGVHMRLA